jgi:hypothetical protein
LKKLPNNACAPHYRALSQAQAETIREEKTKTKRALTALIKMAADFASYRNNREGLTGLSAISSATLIPDYLAKASAALDAEGEKEEKHG